VDLSTGSSAHTVAISFLAGMLRAAVDWCWPWCRDGWRRLRRRVASPPRKAAQGSRGGEVTLNQREFRHATAFHRAKHITVVLSPGQGRKSKGHPDVA
jgi:hypothetical protein